jgi:anaerobic ribonucleoside-triphosphate reductase activating protein
MPELTIGFIDDATGTVLLDDEIEHGAQEDLTELLGQPQGVGCARPLSVNIPPAETSFCPTARISGYWHDDLMVGPGRRSVVRFQGCPIRCIGCWVPETHDENGGYVVGIDQMSEALLDPSHDRDGVTILGGEPFAQPHALWHLVAKLAASDTHIAVYSGYTLARLERMAETDTDIGCVLVCIDMLIDGPYVAALKHSATCGCSDETRRYTGSCNQKVRDMR